MFGYIVGRDLALSGLSLGWDVRRGSKGDGDGAVGQTKGLAFPSYITPK